MTTSDPRRDELSHELVAIVDDDDSARRSLDRLVRSFGYPTQAFASADEFMASSAPQRAACLLLDVRMPGTDGLTLQRRLVERKIRIPVVFITAMAHEDEERRARAAGAIDFLHKPVDQVTLRRALDQAFRALRSARGETDVE